MSLSTWCRDPSVPWSRATATPESSTIMHASLLEHETASSLSWMSSKAVAFDHERPFQVKYSPKLSRATQ